MHVGEKVGNQQGAVQHEPRGAAQAGGEDLSKRSQRRVDWLVSHGLLGIGTRLQGLKRNRGRAMETCGYDWRDRNQAIPTRCTVKGQVKCFRMERWTCAKGQRKEAMARMCGQVGKILGRGHVARQQTGHRVPQETTAAER